MKSYSSNNVHIEDIGHKPRKHKQNHVLDANLYVSSPRSNKSNSDTKLCIFERDKTGYGFKITGNAPVKVQAVRQDGLAWISGLRENDVIIKVNGSPVIDKQHKDVVALIRKETRVELLVESDNSQSISTTTDSFPKTKPPSPSITRIPKLDPNLAKPGNLPRVSPRLKSTSESQLQKPNNNQSLEQNNNVFIPVKQQDEIVSNIKKPDSPDSSSECSISTSSMDSDHSKSGPSKTLPVNSVMKNDSPDGIPKKSNSYNVTSNIIATKHMSLQKAMSPEKVKNKTIPQDGAKSSNPTVSADKESTLNLHPTYSTLPKKKTSELIFGRDFDDDIKDEEESENSLSVIEMLSSIKEALTKPSLVAVLLSYVNEKFEDMKIMLFYYTCKFYKTLILRREFKADAPRMANEIITTFLHEKSPLYITLKTEIIAETMKKFKSGQKMDRIFDNIMEAVYESLKCIVEDVQGKLKRGIQLNEDVSSLVNSVNSSLNPEKEITLLYRTMYTIINKNIKDSTMSDVIYATHIGLSTMYQYFHGSSFLAGASIRSKSSENLNNISNQNKLQTISDYFKLSTFCAPYQQRLSLGLRKKTKSENGHVLSEVACVEPEECAICEGILWGKSPQGMHCSMCTNYYHKTCKKKNKDPCSKKLRKSNSQLNNKEEKSAFFGRLSRKSSTNSVRASTSENINVGGSHFLANASLVPEDKTNFESIDLNNELSKSQSEDQLFRNSSLGRNMEKIRSGPDLNGSPQIDICDNESSNQPNMVHIQELVSDESVNDNDMKMEESFDAETEINSVFPNPNSEIDKKRLIVLLEFYHKTKYILMNLKRFWYSLVKKWPESQNFYFKALSLDCISPFVDLIKSLVVTIEGCITEQDFVGLEQAVLDWLSENNDERLKEWISLSSNLCCTNSLNIVKQMKQTTLRSIHELTNLLKAKFHKLVMIEELTQIRPLLISLPLIVKNIIKCLTKQEQLYSEELDIWKQVSIKMDYLCEYIDRCCIPLVDWINNGSICKRVEKYDIEKDKDFFTEFPRTLFHFPIFDFQFAKIMTWSTNTKKNGSVIQTTYLKKGTEVLLIFYKTFILVLQKDNDHYVLKPVKPFKNIFERQHPVIELTEGIIVKNGGVEEDNFVLNIISHNRDDALLLRIGFSRVEVVNSWLEYIDKKNYNLGNSINLFKNNEFGLMTNSTLHLERYPSTYSGKSKASQELFDNNLLSPINIEVDDKVINRPLDKVEDKPVDKVEDKPIDKVEDNPDNKPDDKDYLLLSETLTKASEILNPKESLCAILKVSENDLPKNIEVFKNEGVKSLEELILVMYTLSQKAIQQTHSLLAKGCNQVTYPSNFDINEVRCMLTTTSEILNKWEERKTINGEVEELIKPKFVIRNRTAPEPDYKNKPKGRLVCLPNIEPTGEVERVPESVKEFTDEVKAIVDEIIEEAISKVISFKNVPDILSYKYVPTDSLLPSVDINGVSNIFNNNVVLTPNYVHLNSPVEETVMVGRAHIVLRNRFSSRSTD